MKIIKCIIFIIALTLISCGSGGDDGGTGSYSPCKKPHEDWVCIGGYGPLEIVDGEVFDISGNPWGNAAFEYGLSTYQGSFEHINAAAPMASGSYEIDCGNNTMTIYHDDSFVSVWK